MKEELSYDDRLPIHIRIGALEEYPLHYHTDIEFIFVLKGEIQLLLGSNNYILKQNEIFVCNGKEVHAMYTTGKENVVALIQVNNRVFSKYYPNLSRSCYRTVTDDANDKRLDFLRTETTKLLCNHISKPYHYQETNVAIIKKLLSYLEANFNYFSIQNNTVINTPIENFTMSKRISRIILSIYENYYKRMTLEDLSSKENLSEYYLSHIIHQYIGISFRDFLSFARVESSQMMVLDENININELYAIAGFSGRHYFEKHFEKWFREKPFDYRQNFLAKVKSEKRQERFNDLETGSILKFLNQYGYCATPSDQALELLAQNSLQVTVDGILGKSIAFIPKISVALNKKIPQNANVSSKFENLKFDEILKSEPSPISEVYGLDTIAGAVYILRNLTLDGISLPFMDSPLNTSILQGTSSIVFSNGIVKCSYYSLLFLGMSKGEMIDRGANYWIIKKAATSDMPSFVIMVFNGNESTDSVCVTPCSKEKTIEEIASFNEEVNIKFSINGLFGAFKIATVSIDSTTDYFYYLNHYGCQSASPEIEHLLAEQYTLPYVNIYNTDAAGTLEMNTRLDGLCVQFITITPLRI